jgi:phosphoribosyl-ATP pyrophosphohydrolase/phosphoribosyl-AMP cyclohydrolase/histidinol dehydrogenase
MAELLRRVAPRDATPAGRTAVDEATVADARAIVDDVAREGDRALRRYAERFDGLEPGAQLVCGRADLERALAAIDPASRALLERTAQRIRAFATAQREAFDDVEVAVPGGRAGHRVVPLARAGCYAPGGLHPLPSSVLMTAVTARVAGVGSVWVASPRPAAITLAAAAVAGADGLYPLGGAQAIAALAHGTESVPAVDIVVGPGNKWVTAAKQLVAHRVAIDMLAGPSELVVLADGTADPALVAADLLGQAEHAPDAWPILVTPSAALAAAVDVALAQQLDTLPTAETARAALASGFAVVCADLDEAAAVCERIAPEHLQLCLAQPEPLARRLRRYGALFVGAAAGEVLGDYGAGPNHVLPTGGTARFSAGLSVGTFLRLRTWLRIDDPAAAAELGRDAAALARLEGLPAHERAAQRRLPLGD